MKRMLVFVFLAMLVGSGLALTAGDIAITGVLADNPDVIGFIPLVDLPGGTVITFTDRAWRNSTNNFPNLTLPEGFLKWTAPAEGITAGTSVTLTSNGVFGSDPFVPSIGSIAETGNLQLSYDSDQVLVFEGATNPTSATSTLWLWGLSLSNWTYAGNAYTTDLPTALQGYAVHFSENGGQYAGVDNVYFADTDPITATRAQMIALLSDPDNFVATDDYISQLPSYSIAVDETLPVELSTFTVNLTSEFFIQVNWTTQSETGVFGFYVLRNSTPDLSSALQVSPLISAQNTSSIQSYSFLDEDISEYGTYYYWLHCIDQDGSEGFHGPVIALYQSPGGPDAPGTPLITELREVYPNPFNPNLIIPYSLDSTHEVDISIFNLRGQLQARFKPGTQNSGNHQLSWDGKDQNGNPASSGLYFVVMRAGGETYLRKAMLMK